MQEEQPPTILLAIVIVTAVTDVHDQCRIHDARLDTLKKIQQEDARCE
jgi:hypothetical protein